MTLRTLCLLLLLTACSCRHRHPDPQFPAVQSGGAAAPAASSRAFSIVSFNVQHRGSEALIRAFQSDAVLRRADVVLLQEMESHPGEGASRAERLAGALGMQYAYGPRYGLGCGATHGLAIVSRRPLSDLEVIELPTYDLHYNLGRVIALAATAQVGGGFVRIYNTHLDTRITPQERLCQLRPLLQRAARVSTPAIVAGDFNSSPFTWALRCIPVPGAGNNAGIRRLMGAYGFDMAPRRPHRTTSLGFRLDWICTRGLEVEACGVRTGVGLSDHYPVWIRAALPATTGQ